LRKLAWLACFLIACSASTNRPNGANYPDAGPGSLVYSQSFAGPEGSDWPAPWYPITNHVTWHDLHNNQGRFRSDGIGAVPGRMELPNFSERDVEAVWTVDFEDPTNQGSGLYVRQSGQYIGEGYVLYIEGIATPPATHLTLWAAVNGVENRFFDVPAAVSPFLPNTRYRVRFQVVQVDTFTTGLRGRIWPPTDNEPSNWQIDTTDTTPSLQNARGTFAFDVYNYSGTANVLVSDLVITRL
jgi:hypothetical protein